MFTGILVSVSGYWVFHLTAAGQLWVHGVAYMPWIMMLMEELLNRRPQIDRGYLIRFFALIFFFFLLINSGYFWLQIAPMIIAGRTISEFIFTRRPQLSEQFKRLGGVLLCGLFAILLSWPRLGAVYEFQLLKFPRLGDHINHMQVIGDTVYLFKTILRSFFDRGYITVPHGEGMLGPGYFEITNFIGLSSVIAVLIGLTSFGRLLKSRLFVGLLFACLVQTCLTRSTHAGDFLRIIAPVYKQITHYWRGSAIWIFTMVVLVACGYEKMLNHPKKTFNICAVVLMLLTLGEIFFTYRTRLDITTNSPLTKIFQEENPPPKPLTEHYAPCVLSNIYGYGHAVTPHLLVNLSEPLYNSPVAGYYNALDVRKIFGPQGNNAYFFDHDWPLWPQCDSAEFNRYINYQQVVELPFRLRFMNDVSGVAWILFLVLWIMVFRMRRVNLSVEKN